MRPLIQTATLVGLSLILSSTLAQTPTLSADDIAGKVEAAQKNLKDFSVHINGSAALEGGNQKIDLEVSSIPLSSLTRTVFNAPDALADNILILDKTTVSNYLYLTNQVTVAPAAKSKVDGFSFDFTRLTDATVSLSRTDFRLKLLETQNLAGGKAYLLEAIPRQDLGVSKTRILVGENGWKVLKLQALDPQGKVVTDLNFSSWKFNSGLKSADLKKLPRDAQVIKR